MDRGIAYGLSSAVLFGMTTPLAKSLVGEVPPLLLAGLLYAGAGVGLLGLLLVTKVRKGEHLALPSRNEAGWLAGAILAGGVLAPVALMYGLQTSSASSASLLLNLEAVLTALLAWFIFRENFDGRIALGMLAIVAGGIVLAFAPGALATAPGTGLIALACLLWAIDNNLTRKVSASDAVVLACVKGLVAGTVNISLAATLGMSAPRLANTAAAALIGFLGYGVSLVLFVLTLRHLGTARAGAYFSIAPLFGAALAVGLLGDPLTWQLLLAIVLMSLGVWLHISERHAHVHRHLAMTHDHAHTHDLHHRHQHAFPWDGVEPHVHAHAHESMTHDHPHYPDVHHRHGH